MEKINFDIACDVANCKHNYNGCNCMLDSIHVGCTCDGDHCTCCENYDDKI